MNSKNMASVVGWAAILVLVISLLISFLFTTTEFVKGKVVDAGYVTEFETVSVFKENNGPQGEAAAIESFYLVIDVKGKTSNYTVERENFRKAITGQTVFEMWCTPFSCSIIE
jgi:hypothetical protein